LIHFYKREIKIKQRSKMKTLISILTIIAISEGRMENYIRNERNALPQEIFRETVEPSKGGKVPEAAHMRVELNRIDSAGLDNADAVAMEQEMAAAAPELPDHAPNEILVDSKNKYNPGRTPALKLKPDYHPPKQTYNPEPAFVPEPVYVPQPKPTYAPAPAYVPEPAYGAQPVYAPEPAYVPEAPAYVAPVGPVLLENRPHEVKSVQPLPITVEDTYTSFDCRTKPYPGRHYADPEAGCEIYHFCHEDGKQDTFSCSYGTLYNEYLGTCDYKNNVHCTTGEGYIPKHAPKPSVYHPAPAYHKPAPAYHTTAPAYHAPAPAYHSPAPAYHSPAPAYQQPNVGYHEPAYHQPAPAYKKPEPFTNFGRK